MTNKAISILKKNNNNVVDLWMKKQIANSTLRDDLITNEDLRAQSEELVKSLLSSLSDENINDPKNSDFDPVVEILGSISLSRAKQGFSPRETGVYVFSLKEALLETLRANLKDSQELYSQSMLIISLIDSFGVSTFESFIHGREEVILRQTSEIEEISTPVIKVWDGILALPIIGTLDSSRTQTVMENLLQRIVETGCSIVILDISGVPAVDSLVAQHLMKTVTACRLMGVECIISGIRPEIAQTIVHLGIDLSKITTKATLASALKTAFNLAQLTVTKTTD
jgi:rsbT co-antagonist protein RsbR